MIPPIKPANEAERIRSLIECELLDTATNSRFDKLAAKTKMQFGCDIALISLVDSDRQWFKSCQGLEASETSREISFCGHAILREKIFHISDARLDERFTDNPLVTGPPFIRFYAGAPLKSEEGYHIGTLCIIDSSPRNLNAEEFTQLRLMADFVENEIALQRANRRNESLRILTGITSLASTKPEFALQTALDFACDHLDFDCGIVSEIKNNTYKVLVKSAFTDNLITKSIYRTDQTLCQHTIKDVCAFAIANIEISEHEGQPSCLAFRPGSYLGVPVFIEGKLFGTLCFFSKNSRLRPFVKREIEFIDKLGMWAANKVQQWQLDLVLKQKQRMSNAVSKAQLQFINSGNAPAFNGLLNELLSLSESTYGFIGEVLQTENSAKQIKIKTIANANWSRETRSTYANKTEEGFYCRDLPPLLYEVIQSGKTTFALNTEEGLPGAQNATMTFLAAPIYYANEIIAVFCVGNQESAYKSSLVEHLSPLLSAIGQLVLASRIKEQNEIQQKIIKRLSEVANQTINGVIITDLEGNVEWVNNGFTRITGYELDDFIGRKPGSILQGKDTDPKTAEKMRAAIKARHSFDVEIINYNRQGVPYWIHIICNPLVNKQGDMEGFIAIETDITQRKQLEQIKGEFVATINHELRTPLTSIIGAIDLVLNKSSDELPEKQRKMLKIAVRNGDRLKQLINDLLDMDKLISGRIKIPLARYSLLPLLQEAIADNQPFAEQYQVTIQLTETENASVLVERSRLLQVMANFLSNAAKFSHPDSQIEVSAKIHGDIVRVAVKDQGIGIPTKFHDQLFTKFMQVDASDGRRRGGTGLGLAISKEIIEQMHGSIGFTSEKDKGSCFYFDLPVIKG